jgi:hypothetical protein
MRLRLPTFHSLRASPLYWHANHADTNLFAHVVGIFETGTLCQLLGLERFRQDDKFKALVFE